MLQHGITPYVEKATHESGSPIINICNLSDISHASILAGVERLIKDMDKEVQELYTLPLTDVFHDQAIQVMERIRQIEHEKDFLKGLLKRINKQHLE